MSDFTPGDTCIIRHIGRNHGRLTDALLQDVDVTYDVEDATGNRVQAGQTVRVVISIADMADDDATERIRRVEAALAENLGIAASHIA